MSKLIITTLGTRGETEETSRHHKRFSATLYEYEGKRLLVDAGRGWNVKDIKPDWILITHTHDDHDGGLYAGIDFPIYASKISSDWLKNQGIRAVPFDNITLGPFKIERFDVAHSLKAPASSFKISVPEATVMHTGDILHPHDIKKFMADVDILVGNGSAMDWRILRRSKKEEDPYGHPDDFFGHASVKDQVGWAENYGAKAVIITHFGKEAIEMAENLLVAQLKEMSDSIPVLEARDGERFDAHKVVNLRMSSPQSASGLYLVAPHAQWIWAGKKKLIVKARKFHKQIHKSLLLVGPRFIWGVISLDAPHEIDLKRFGELSGRHLISVEERQKWWPTKTSLFAYEFSFKKFKERF